MDVNLKNRLKKIKLLIMDVDGILTDGSINIDDNGREIKRFDVKDGLGISVFRKAGFKTAILSARSCNAVVARAQDLKIDKVCLDAFPKIGAYNEILKHFGFADKEVCFMGDDLPDLAVLKKVGLAVTVKDAVPEVKKAAHYVTKAQGGRGAVREVIELILKSNGKWQEVLRLMI